jgi:hypothetical protein
MTIRKQYAEIPESTGIENGEVNFLCTECNYSMMNYGSAENGKHGYSAKKK